LKFGASGSNVLVSYGDTGGELVGSLVPAGTGDANSPGYVSGIAADVSAVITLPVGYTIRMLLLPNGERFVVSEDWKSGAAHPGKPFYPDADVDPNLDTNVFQCPPVRVFKAGVYVFTIMDSTDRVLTYRFTVPASAFGQMEIRADANVILPLGDAGNGAPFFSTYDSSLTLDTAVAADYLALFNSAGVINDVAGYMAENPSYAPRQVVGIDYGSGASNLAKSPYFPELGDEVVQLSISEVDIAKLKSLKGATAVMSVDVEIKAEFDSLASGVTNSVTKTVRVTAAPAGTALRLFAVNPGDFADGLGALIDPNNASTTNLSSYLSVFPDDTYKLTEGDVPDVRVLVPAGYSASEV
jgi:hypothetical protein